MFNACYASPWPALPHEKKEQYAAIHEPEGLRRGARAAK